MTLVILLTVLAAAFLWGQGLRARAQLREQVLLQAEQRSLHLADAMAGQVDGLFGMLDLALLDMRRQWLKGRPSDFAEMVSDVVPALPPGLVSHATVVDARGQVVYNSLGQEIGTYVGDRDHFKALRDGGDRMVIGAPVKSRLTGQWLFVVGRPVLRDGVFDGTVHLLVSTPFLASKLAALALSAQDIVGLVHANGHFMARSLDNDGAMGNKLPADRPFLTNPSQRFGVFREAGALDQVPRTFGWNRLPGSGAVLVIGLADSSVLDPLAPALRRGHLLTAVLTLLLLAGGGTIAYLIWRVSRSQAAAVASEERLKEAQHMARVGNWEYDHATRRLTWSDEVFRIFGMYPGKDQPSYSHFLSVVHPEDRDRVIAAFNEAVKQHHLYNVVHRIVLADGRVKHVRELGLNTYDGERPVSSKGTIQDITETRTAQLALQELNDELERRVDERTRELGAVNRELEAFAYSVSHDLRTPLRSIHGFASLLEEDFTDMPDAAHGHLRRIQDAARRMGVLITDLLSMAHHGRAPVRHERVNLSELARAIVGDLEREDPRRVVRWEIEEGLSVWADPLLMRVVLQNLLGNAWKYSGQTERPHIAFTRTSHADGMQAFCVRDNGAGFDMAYVQQLFQPFKRLHTNQQFEGSGVGLATVQRVVQRHGGTVRGEGAVGQGAAFHFTLPDEPVVRDTAQG